MNLLDRTVLRICKVAGIDPDVNLQGKIRFVLQDFQLDCTGEKCRHERFRSLPPLPVDGERIHLEYCLSCGMLRFSFPSRLGGAEEEPVPDLFFNRRIGGTPAELSDLEGEEEEEQEALVMAEEAIGRLWGFWYGKTLIASAGCNVEALDAAWDKLLAVLDVEAVQQAVERRRALEEVVSCVRRQFLSRSRGKLSGRLRDALSALDEVEGREYAEGG